MQKLNINGMEISFKLNSGAEVNVLPRIYFVEVGYVDRLQNANVTLVAYGGFTFKIKPLGKIAIDQPPIFGLLDCLALDLNRRVDSVMSKIFNWKNQVLSLYAHVFKRLGQFPTCHRKI